MRARLTKVARAARDLEICRLLREGIPAFEIAQQLDCHITRVDNLRRDLGIAPTRRPGGNQKGLQKESTELQAMLDECKRELGPSLVRKLLGDEPDLEGPELVRLYAALRVAVLGAEDLLVIVKSRFAEIRRARLDDLARRGLGEMVL